MKKVKKLQAEKIPQFRSLRDGFYQYNGEPWLPHDFSCVVKLL